MPLVQRKKFGLHNGKCAECGACGEKFCCGPEMCKMSFSSNYCKFYLWELQNTYKSNEAILALLYSYKEQFPELLSEVESLLHEFDYVEFEEE